MSSGPSFPSSQANPLLASFTSFLTIAIHSLLYHRALYPAPSFLTTRAYNLPVHQSRHPLVCAWISDAIAALTTHLARGAVSRIALVVHGPPHSGAADSSSSGSSSSNNNDSNERNVISLPCGTAVLERWVFDVRDFPTWGPLPRNTLPPSDAEEPEPDSAAAAAAAAADAAGAAPDDTINWADIHEELRAALTRLAYAAEKTPALPANCTFTLAIELRDDAEAPIGHPQPWIPSPSAPPVTAQGAASTNPSSELASTCPVRSVRAGPLFFECWLETRDIQPPTTISQSSSDRPS